MAGTETDESRNEASVQSGRSIVPFLSLLSKFQFKQPPSALESQQQQIEKKSNIDETNGEFGGDKPAVVSLSGSKKPREISPLKLECDKAPEQGSNPVVLWQVYALGGFMILKWVWAKWQEKKSKDKKDSSSTRTEEDSSEELPPSAPSPGASESPSL